LVLGLGAVPRALYQHAITIGDPVAALLPHLIDDLDAGRVTRLAFIAPERTAWPLPLYEVALMCAARAGDRNLAVELTVITAERTPLHIFGETASTQMTRLLSEHGIEIVCDARCDVPAPGRVVITAARCPPALHSPPTRALSVDRVVAVPELVGPHVRGLPCAENGFIPIDRFCRVPGTKAIFAAGDATDYAIKHGGIAAQQADVAARSIAALAGAAVTPRPFHPTIAGLLLTGGEPRYLTARVTGGEPFGSRMTVPVAEATPPKIAARYLNELLQRLQR
jgi:sulfide:quinone oxidoreductase